MLDKSTLAAQPAGMDDVQTMQKLQCEVFYEKFNDCMADNNRDWSQCRNEVGQLDVA